MAAAPACGSGRGTSRHSAGSRTGSRPTGSGCCASPSTGSCSGGIHTARSTSSTTPAENPPPGAGLGQDRPDSVYAVPPPSRVRRAASIRRAVKSAHCARTSSERAELRGPDLAGLVDRVVEDRGVGHAAVEHQAERVVPAAPGRQPVGQQEGTGLRPGDRAPPRPRGRPPPAGDSDDLDDAAGQVPVVLVGQPAQQHPAVGVAHQHLGDRPLAGQEGVQQGPEAGGLGARRVGREPGQHHWRWRRRGRPSRGRPA